MNIQIIENNSLEKWRKKNENINNDSFDASHGSSGFCPDLL